MSGKRVLLLGGGGREHAMAWKLSQSSQLDQLFISPGNPGTANHGINIELNNSKFSLIEQFVEQENIDLIIVGPEQPLVDGIADYFADKNIAVLALRKLPHSLRGVKSLQKILCRHTVFLRQILKHLRQTILMTHPNTQNRKDLILLC